MALNSTAEILAEIKAGKMTILVDDEERENEGDLVLGAEFATAGHINFMATHGRGLICLTLTETHCRQLNLPLMVARNRSSPGTNFTVSIEASRGVTTGISAADRARTIQAAVACDATPDDIVQPGHIFPLMAQKGGVLSRAGHTEAGCDLAQLAGLTAAAVICEIMNDNGEMARLPDLVEFAERHDLKIGSIADLIHYRSQTESLVTRVAERPIQTLHGEFTLVVYNDQTTQATHLALVKGEIAAAEETLVRVHEPLSVMDLLDAGDRRHSWNLNDTLQTIAHAKRGVIVLLHKPETAAELLDRARGTAPVNTDQSRIDLRNYGIGAQILRDLNVRKMRLLAAPRKMPSMAGFGLEVTGHELPD
ncbi:MAG: 3,4-dihydroxy-2-butanone-4-phosphate synthase [Burkholderiales bacterium]|nr:3,4-dihydroxy-2-butanone-4-phosphate synthase [Burkholderiales bacterium]